MNRLSKTESAIFVSLMCPLLLENLHSELILQFDKSFPNRLYEPYGIYKHYIRLLLTVETNIIDWI